MCYDKWENTKEKYVQAETRNEKELNAATIK